MEFIIVTKLNNCLYFKLTFFSKKSVRLKSFFMFPSICLNVSKFSEILLTGVLFVKNGKASILQFVLALSATAIILGSISNFSNCTLGDIKLFNPSTKLCSFEKSIKTPPLRVASAMSPTRGIVAFICGAASLHSNKGVIEANAYLEAIESELSIIALDKSKASGFSFDIFGNFSIRNLKKLFMKKNLIGSNFIYKDKELSIVLNSAFYYLLKFDFLKKSGDEETVLTCSHKIGCHSELVSESDQL